MNETYSIQQVSKLTGVSTHTLRYYEKIGLLPGIQRNRSGHRLYDEDDVGWIRWLKLLRSTGMPIQTITQFVRLSQEGQDTIAARCQILDGHRQELRQRITELQGFLDMLDQKVEFYRGLAHESA